MDIIVNYFDSLGLDFWVLAKIGLTLLLGTFLTGLFGRFVFGKRSMLNNAVSSTIAVLFIYAITVVLKSIGVQFESLIAPLPFVTISNDYLYIFSFHGSDYTIICAELLSALILAFLVNLADGWFSKSKNLLSWIFFRCLTVIVAFFMHLIVVFLFTTYLPEGIVTYAPTILLAILLLMLVTGSLKIIVGALLSSVDPIIGGLYTFFFATVVGKQVTRAVITTAILSGLIVLLNYLECTVIAVSAAALMAYIPFVILVVALWYIIYYIF